MPNGDTTQRTWTLPDFGEATDRAIPLMAGFEAELDARIEGPVEEGATLSGLLSLAEHSSGGQRIGHLRRAARMLDEELGDPQEALEALTLAWLLDPTDERSGDELERLARRTGSVREILAAARSELSRPPARAARIAIRTRCAGWHAELGQPLEARACLDAILAEQAAHQGALEAMAELLQAQGDWPAVAETWGRLATLERSPRREAGRYVALGDLYAQRLASPEDAAAAYLAALGTVPDHEQALERLDTLYGQGLDPAQDGPDDVRPLRALLAHHGRRGDHAATLRVLDRLTACAPGVQERVELHTMGARLRLNERDDPRGALVHCEQIIALAPLHREANDMRRRILEALGDFRALAAALEAEASQVGRAEEQGALLARLGRLYAEHLDDAQGALAAYERAVHSDPGQLEAATALASMHLAAGEHERAFGLLHPLAARLPIEEKRLKARVRHMLGEAAYQTARHGEAIAALSAIGEPEATAAGLLLLVRACFHEGRFAEVVRHCRPLLVDHEAALDLGSWVEAHHMLGVAQGRLGDVGAAARAFRAGLSRAPGHAATLDALVALETKRERWEAVAQLLEQRAEHCDGPSEGVRLLESLGDLCRERLGQLPRALGVYRSALRLCPTDHRALHKLLLTCQQAGRWEEAVEVLGRIAGIEPRPAPRARYAYTAGVILRDELGDPGRALERFHEALSVDPSHLKAFAAIDTMLTRERAWPQLERSYRRALKDVMGRGDPSVERQLWHNLGLIYRDRLDEWGKAVDAFRMASRLRPEDREGHRILSELFTRVRAGFTEYVAEHQEILRREPTSTAPYHAFFELHARSGDRRRARAAAAALVLLHDADTVEREWLSRCAPPVLAPERSLRPGHWAALRHPDLDAGVSVIFEAFAEPLRKLRARPDVELGLDPRLQVERGGSQERVAMLFGGLSRTLRTSVAPRLFIDAGRPGGLCHVEGTLPAASLCGSTPLTCFDTARLEFVVAHHLSDHVDELSIRAVVAGPAELEAVLRAAMHLYGSPQSEPAVARAAQRLGPMVEGRRQMGLRRACARLAGRDLRLVAVRWAAAAELTSCRVGFLICRDLGAAASVLRDMPRDPSGLRTRDRIGELLRFSVSDAYFDLMDALAAR